MKRKINTNINKERTSKPLPRIVISGSAALFLIHVLISTMIGSHQGDARSGLHFNFEYGSPVASHSDNDVVGLDKRTGDKK
jgi:hypothetical protein